MIHHDQPRPGAGQIPPSPITTFCTSGVSETQINTTSERAASAGDRSPLLPRAISSSACACARCGRKPMTGLPRELAWPCGELHDAEIR